MPYVLGISFETPQGAFTMNNQKKAIDQMIKTFSESAKQSIFREFLFSDIRMPDSHIKEMFSRPLHPYKLPGFFGKNDNTRINEISQKNPSENKSIPILNSQSPTREFQKRTVIIEFQLGKAKTEKEDCDK
jgi:hypothetical protein